MICYVILHLNWELNPYSTNRIDLSRNSCKKHLCFVRNENHSNPINYHNQWKKYYMSPILFESTGGCIEEGMRKNSIIDITAAHPF